MPSKKTGRRETAKTKTKAKPPAREPARMGRPPRLEPAEKITLRIHPDLVKWLQHRRVDERRSMSDIVAGLIDAYRQKVDK